MFDSKKSKRQVSPCYMRFDFGNVTLSKGDQVAELLEYYMGKNTMDRQNFIIDNLVIEEDFAEEYE